MILLQIKSNRAARLTTTTGIVLWWILTNHCSWQLELDESLAVSGFGYELLIAKMDLLEQKIVDLELTVSELKADRRTCTCTDERTTTTTQMVEIEDQSPKYKSCSDAPVQTPGLVQLKPPGGPSFEALCDFINFGGNWTIIQHRFSGQVDFYRTWDEYKNGFGDLRGEFWLGLDKIHRITNSGNFEILFVLVDWDFKLLRASYDSFRIGSEEQAYILDELGTYKGSAGDSFSYHKGMKFTTLDRKNDNIPGSNNNCAVTFHGAWWYNNCQTSNLNGRYRGAGESTCWNTHNPPKYAWCSGFSSTKIMIREKK